MKFLKTVGLVAVSVVAALLLLEGGLRILGYRMPPKSGYHTRGWAQRDEDVGWRYTAGVWPADCLLKPLTVLDNETRKVTGQPTDATGPTIVLIGGSFAAGYGVTDEDSMASRLQADYPEARVINLATPGYGTYQSYLMLKKYQAEHPDVHVDMVVYGYAPHHQVRNVADWRWISALKSYAGGQLVPPVLEKNKAGQWEEKPSVEHNLLSMASFSDLVFFVQSAILSRHYGIKDAAYQMEATCRAFQLLHDYCRSKAMAFVAVNIFNGLSTNQQPLVDYCQAHGITYIKAPLDVSGTDPQWMLCVSGGSGHPNPRFHQEMGREIATILKGLPDRGSLVLESSGQ